MVDTDSEPTTFGGQVVYLSGSALPPATQSPSARARRSTEAEAHVALEDRAVHVVSDFTWEQPVTIAENRSINEALREMIFAGVHALLVVQGDVVTGLITSYDIQNDHLSPPRTPTSTHTRRDEIQVGHIMTHWDQITTLDWQHVCTIRVFDVVKLLKRTRATHVVIVEYADQGGIFVRGLISRLRIERQLGCS